MALSCALTVTPSSYRVGNTPPPQLLLTVTNANAFAVTVTAVRVYTKIGATVVNMPFGEISFPIGPGLTTVVPASSNITMGPVAFVLASAANNSAFEAVLPSGGSNFNPQPSQNPSFTAVIAATVYGSDGSINEASTASLTVTPTVP